MNQVYSHFIMHAYFELRILKHASIEMMLHLVILPNIPQLKTLSNPLSLVDLAHTHTKAQLKNHDTDCRPDRPA